jgi:hypothetical protein
MKKIITLIGLTVFLGGCSWFGHGDQGGSGSGESSVAGVDYGPGRGTTGVSSGADAGPGGITGSDAAPPR